MLNDQLLGLTQQRAKRRQISPIIAAPTTAKERAVQQSGNLVEGLLKADLISYS
jgi:hypothetical protein